MSDSSDLINYVILVIVLVLVDIAMSYFVNAVFDSLFTTGTIDSLLEVIRFILTMPVNLIWTIALATITYFQKIG